ncbi:hypothetical protein N7512_003119 [Penicillium capsulatum]|nr:hypothetical protein N7512_003119 [Penicillium capsulatum]
MAGSQRSPVLRDQWSADPGHDPRDRDRRRGRGSHRDQGRNRYRGRGHHRQNNRGFDHPERSPPERVSRFRPDSSHGPGDFGLDRSPLRGSPGPSPGSHENRRFNRPRASSPNDYTPGPFNNDGRAFHRDHSPSGPQANAKEPAVLLLEGQLHEDLSLNVVLRLTSMGIVATEAHRIKLEAGSLVEVVLDGDPLDVAGTVVEETAAVQISPGEAALDPL